MRKSPGKFAHHGLVELQSFIDQVGHSAVFVLDVVEGQLGIQNVVVQFLSLEFEPKEYELQLGCLICWRARNKAEDRVGVPRLFGSSGNSLF